jgi:hypothetical protein
LSIVAPGARLMLLLDLATDTRLGFNYFYEKKKFSSGTLRFGAP